MSNVTILWSGVAAATLLLALVHLVIWLQDRKAYVNLVLTVIALSLVGIAFTELGMMFSTSPGEWANWVRWCHLPLFFFFCGIVVFVRLHLGTGRLWLMWSILAMRGLILVLNFLHPPNFNFDSVTELRSMQFLGDTVSVLGAGETGRWQWFATLSNLLFLAYFFDAAFSLWRKEGREQQRRALLLGTSVLVAASLAVLLTQTVIWGMVQMPILITPPYLIAVGAMAYELSRDTLRAGLLSRNLRESENRLELAADAARLGLWSWDTRHDNLWVTDRARTILGFQPGETINPEALRSRVHEDDLPRVREALQKSIDGRTKFNLEFRTRTADGATHWIASQGAADSDGQGRVTLVRGVLRDVSDLKKSHEETEELRRAVSHSGRVTMLGQLASSLAHELSQPLGATLRNTEAAEILFRSPLPNLPELHAIISDIHNDGRRAGDIIDRLRALLKRRPMQFQPLSVGALVTDASTLLRGDAASRHVELVYTLASPLPDVTADRVHLSQVLINLVLNGMDAVCDSNAAVRRVTVSARAAAPDAVELRVADTGPGIATEVLPQIFEPFFTTRAGGMGMGLAISRTIVEAHGGRLWAENDTTQGAVFCIRLPAAGSAPA